MPMLNRTIADLRRRSDYRARITARAAKVVSAMRDGQALHLQHSRHGAVWWLSGGTRVDDEVARAVIKDPSVVGVGDALPLGADVPAQTFRFAE
jgi:ABC-type lipopolysaccharide export system ATPase subunit